MQVFEPQRGDMFIVANQIKDPSSVRSGMEIGHVAPMGLFSLSDLYYKHAAPNGAGPERYG
jgi:hypothetical protein